MKVLSQSVGTIVYNKVSEVLDENEPDNTDRTTVEYQVKQTSKEITARCIGVVVSHPFHGLKITLNPFKKALTN